MISTTGRYVLIGLIAASVAASYVWIYSVGNSHGKDTVTALWNQKKEEQNKAINLEKDKNALLEAENRALTEKVNYDLAEAQRKHDLAVASLKSDYASRLLQSEKRAAVYKRQAEGGSSQCADLASHAAGLDGSLEQGRSLVAELSETLRLRDQQLISVGDKLLADEKLLTNSGN